MPRDSVGRTFLVATTLCLVCSVLVSAAAVGLRSLQNANKDRERKKNILIAAGLYREDVPVNQAFEQIEPRVVDLESGEYVPEEDPALYDQRLASRDPDRSVEIPPGEDLGGIKRREKLSLIFLVKKGKEIEQIVLPVNGKGLWSTLYGFIALEGDMTTVSGLTFYQHGETPGLGGEVDNPAWKAKWVGKMAFGEDLEPQLEVIKGTVDPGGKRAAHQVDGLSGATITSLGVTNLLRYWLGDHGFGPFLKRLRKEGGLDG